MAACATTAEHIGRAATDLAMFRAAHAACPGQNEISDCFGSFIRYPLWLALSHAFDHVRDLFLVSLFAFIARFPVTRRLNTGLDIV